MANLLFGYVMVQVAATLRQSKVRELADGRFFAGLEFSVASAAGETNITGCVLGLRRVAEAQAFHVGDVCIMGGPAVPHNGWLNVSAERIRQVPNTAGASFSACTGTVAGVVHTIRFAKRSTGEAFAVVTLETMGQSEALGHLSGVPFSALVVVPNVDRVRGVEVGDRLVCRGSMRIRGGAFECVAADVMPLYADVDAGAHVEALKASGRPIPSRLASEARGL